MWLSEILNIVSTSFTFEELMFTFALIVTSVTHLWEAVPS